MRALLPALALTLTACPIVVRPVGSDASPDVTAPDVTAPDVTAPDVTTPDAPRVCVPGARRCVSRDTVESCRMDGAGVVTTRCPATFACSEGACRCVGRCDGRVCGGDGCGGTCGACPGGARCTPEGTCATEAQRCEGDVARLCYTGPAGTLGNGACRRGVQRCEGGLWGACEREVLPREDTCDDGVDSDCDGETSEDCPLTERCAPRPFGDVVARGTTLGAGRNLRGSCGGVSAEDVALAWTAPADGDYTFSTENSRFDTLLYVRDGCAGRELACNDDAAEGVTSSRVTVTLRAGQQVVVVVDGFDQSSGSFEVRVARGPAMPCTPGATRRCAGAAMARDVGRCRQGTQTCTRGGVWGDACEGEVAPLASERCGDGVDDTCDGRVDEGCEAVPTRSFTGLVTRVRRVVSADREGYVDAPDAPAAGATVSVRRGSVVLARARTDASGRFTVATPANVTPTDELVLEAGAADDRGTWRYAVARDPGRAEPRLAPFRSPVAPTVWSTSWPLTRALSGAPLRVEGDGAARAFELFEDTRAVVAAAEQAFGRAAPPVLVWYWPGAGWTCGSCFGARGVDALGQHFAAQLAISGEATFEHVWGRAVSTHELGHWVMSTWATSPREGGTHFLGVLSPPGLAWSEGWASWFGSAVRGDPVHVITTGGVTFWFDLAARRTNNTDLGVVWPRPSASQGLLQWMDETELSAMLWSASRALTPSPLYAALASRRMNTAPYARGYRNPDGLSVPVLPDFLDALVCGGAARPAVQSAVGPYPYDAASPTCTHEAPVALAWARREGRDVARVTCNAPLAAPLAVAVTRGAEVLWRASLRCDAGRVHERDLGDAAGATLTVDLQRRDFGVHGALRLEGAAGPTVTAGSAARR